MPSLTKGAASPLIFPNAFSGNTPQQGGPYDSAGAPSAGTSCVQLVTTGGTPTGGTFTLTFGGQTTGSIAWSATDATLEANIAAALNALSNIGPGGVAVTADTGSSGIGSYYVTFQAQNANLAVPAILPGVNSMAGTAPTLATSVSTTGVTGTLRGSYPGTVVADYTKPALWANVGTTTAPAFSRADRFISVMPVTAATVSTAGAAGVWQPSEGGPVFIERIWVNVTTVSSGAATLSVGWGSSASTKYTNLLNAQDGHSAAGVFDNITNQIQTATGAESGLINLVTYMPAADYMTFSVSATVAGLVATAYIAYFKP